MTSCDSQQLEASAGGHARTRSATIQPTREHCGRTKHFRNNLCDEAERGSSWVLGKLSLDVLSTVDLEQGKLEPAYGQKRGHFVLEQGQKDGRKR
jgi:hypothetical protein